MTAVLASFTLSASTVTGGESVKANVTLDAPAPAGGAVVKISSSTSVATCPPSITIPADQTASEFDVGTRPVDDEVDAVLAAEYGGRRLEAPLTIVQAVTLKRLALGARSVLGGTEVKAVLTLDAPARPGGITVQVRTDRSDAISPPPTVVVPGNADTVAFAIATKPTTTGADGFVFAMYGVSAVYAPLGVEATVPAKLELPDKVSPLIYNQKGTLTLNGPAPQNMLVVLKASDPRLLFLAPGVLFNAGETSKTFYLAALVVPAPTPVTVTAGPVTGHTTIMPL